MISKTRANKTIRNWLSARRFAHNLLNFWFAAILVAAPCSARMQQDTKPSSAQASSNAPGAESQKPQTLKDAIQKKKVLTEDDLHPQSGRKDLAEDDSRDFNPICNPQCEQLVRDQLFTDINSELEFRNKFTFATQQIDEDIKWGNAVVAAVHAAGDYCNLERNRAQYAYPNARPPYTTDKLNFDFINKQRDLVNKYVMAKGDVEMRIRGVRPTDPFRAVVMQSQWDAALERSCRGVDHI